MVHLIYGGCALARPSSLINAAFIKYMAAIACSHIMVCSLARSAACMHTSWRSIPRTQLAHRDAD